MTTVENLQQARDIRGLIRLLDHGNTDLQWRAADALGTLGEPACDPLIKILGFPRVNVRIGAIEALGSIKCARSLDPLILKLKSDPDSEVRWVAALALGEIGDFRAVPALEGALTDRDRYVRYGAVTSLEVLNWKPGDDTKRICALIAPAGLEGNPAIWPGSCRSPCQDLSSGYDAIDTLTLRQTAWRTVW